MGLENLLLGLLLSGCLSLYSIFYFIFLFSADCGEAGTKKKKACKNCTCGLAEELDAEAEEKQKSKTVTSSCGSVCDLLNFNHCLGRANECWWSGALLFIWHVGPSVCQFSFVDTLMFHEISYLTFSEIRKDVAKLVVCCSRDWRLRINYKTLSRSLLLNGQAFTVTGLAQA